MLDLEQARADIFKAVTPLGSETVPISEADGRILREDIFASLDLPAFTNSAMDGYAVRSADLAPASPAAPVRLHLRSKIPAGTVMLEALGPGQCARIFTGSPLPTGADAVVMQEDCLPDPSFPETIAFPGKAEPGENIRRQGEDVRKGHKVLSAGVALSPGRIALLGSLGWNEAKVGKRPAVGILATGDELQEAGEPGLAPGKLYESNRATLAALTRRAGGVPRIYPIVKDNLAATGEALDRASAETDLTVTSGGVSVGEFDLVRQAYESLGGRIHLWRISLKPGKPFAFGQRGDKLFFGLPGNPVSSFVTFLLLVYPVLIRLQGGEALAPAAVCAVLAEPLANPGSRRHFVRVIVDAEGRARSAGPQASHRLGSLAGANALVDVPPGTTLASGTVVTVIPI